MGEVKNVTISRKCGKWFVSIQTEYEIKTPTPNGGEIGIDMGIVRFATLSNGEYFEPINAFKTLKGKLAKTESQNCQIALQNSQYSEKPFASNQQQNQQEPRYCVC